jgi:DNA-binding NtrC family response regulator
MACRSQGTVLIAGETGTGKSTLARVIHERSSRYSGPFVSVNLATLYEGTLEAELFGYEKGAFTGADQRRTGFLESAQGGTVFLDEIGELSLRLQARLLEFLQWRTIRPLGGRQELSLDVRVIAATHRDLAEAVRKKEFREDLFHRVRVLPISLKPLRERVDELDTLVHSYLAEIVKDQQKRIHRLSAEVAERLEWYDWPGNLRELRNVLEYAVLATEGQEILLEHLPDWLSGEMTPEAQPELTEPQLLWGAREENGLGCIELPFFWDYKKTRETFEKEFFRRALNQQGGRVSRTAHKIGLNKATLARRMKAYSLRQTPADTSPSKK